MADNAALSSGTATPHDQMSHIDETVNSPVSPPKEEQESKANYIMTIIFLSFVAFGGFVFGWDTGTISGFVNMSNFIERFGERNHEGVYYFSNVRTGLIVSIFNVGCAIGGIFLSKIADVYGRRPGLMVMAIIYIVGILIQITSFHAWYQYFIGRIISGLAVGGISVISPMLISESAPKAIRGLCVSIYQLMITAGIFLGYCTTYGTKDYTNSGQWRVPLGLSFVWAIFLVVGMVSIPESPRYLVQKDLLDQARVAIARTANRSPDHPEVYAEVEAMHAGVLKENSCGKASWGELVTGRPRLLLRVISGILIQSLQQLTGDNYFFYYGTTIFKAVGLSDSFETSIVLGVINFASTFLGIFLVDRFGRRQLLLGGAVSMFVCFIIFAALGGRSLYPHGKSQPANESAGDGMIFLACLFIFCFATTWAPLAYVVVSEIYPIRIRSKAIALASAANWLWGFLISFFTPFITTAIGFYYGFVFAGCLAFAAFFVYFVIPETKGLSLEEIDELYESKVSAWASSGWKPSVNFSQEQAYEKAQVPPADHVELHE